MTTLDYLRELTREAIEACSNQSVRVSTSLRRAIRIATLRNDVFALMWLEMEADSHIGTSRNERVLRRAELSAQINATGDEDDSTLRAAQIYFTGRKITADKDSNVLPSSVRELEISAQDIRETLDMLATPAGMHPQDTYVVSKSNRDHALTLREHLREVESILSRIEDRIYLFLVRTEAHFF